MKYGVFALLIALVPLAHADRYYTWVDEYGRVRHTLIPEKPQPAKSAHKDSGTEAGKEREESDSTPNGLEQVDGQAGTTPASAQTAGSDGFSESDYIDAEELQRQGYVRAEEERRFYTWMDHNGVIQSSPYPPATAGGTSSPRPDSGKRISPFLQIERYQHHPPVDQARVDEFARRLFQLDQPPQGRLGRLSQHCCADLSSSEIVEMDLENGYTLEFDADSDKYPFATGDSVYQLIRLPASRHEYMLRIQSFVKGEVFYPALVFLNDRFEPRRLVANVVHDFEPENWFRYGYLEGWVNVEPQHNDTYLLILTLKEDLNRHSMVKRKKRDVPVKHSQQGLLHISVDAEF